MPKKTDIKILDKKIKLSSSGISAKAISKEVGLCYETVKRFIRKEIKKDPEKTSRFHNLLIQERLTAPLSTVAKKYNLNYSYVSNVTNRSPLKSKFVTAASINAKKRKDLELKRKAELVKNKPLPIIRKKKVDTPKEGNIDLIQKCEVKLKSTEKKLPTLSRDNSKVRVVRLDSRTEKLLYPGQKGYDKPIEELRSEWRSMQDEGLRKLVG